MEPGARHNSRMSFTTRCPACGTVFRVVADQLKISDGWVRCGHCSDVFDATIHLQAWAPPVKAPTLPNELLAEVPQAETPPLQAVEAKMEPAPAPAPVPAGEVPADDDLHAWFGEGPLDAPATAAPVPMETAVVVESPMAEEPPEADADTADDAARSSEGALSADFHAELERFAQTTRSSTSVATLPASAREAAPEAAAPSNLRPIDDDDDAAPEGAAAVPGFVRQARRRAYWTSPGVRAGLVALACLLVVLLAGQWAIQERHRLVAMHPEARPWVEQACGWLGCDLAPIRRIDAVEIESAELVRRLGNFYSFDFVLRNRSTLEVALPALELTLTNIGEQPVARRVFLPRDWPDAPTALSPNGSVSVSLRLSLMLGEDTPTAGYRALVFYP